MENKDVEEKTLHISQKNNSRVHIFLNSGTHINGFIDNHNDNSILLRHGTIIKLLNKHDIAFIVPEK